ncbi:DUF1186 domain-containing protein [Thalassotalea sp. PLHSN55]|uniref:DUF1186 domain-containing protein n=1 Tax=Thalassotalea sp. PLHSN55 TaxID=3435888 RepID=UPI003F82BC5C
MNVEQILLAISNTSDNELTIEGIEAAKLNWSEFYPALESLMDQFIVDDTSLTHEQEAIAFFGTLLLAELKYTPALAKCLQFFSRNDSPLTPLDTIFGDALTEQIPTVFYNLADNNTQALSNFIVDGHQAMYCKGSAMEAIFAQYEAGSLERNELVQHVTRWLTVFLAMPSANNSFLISVLADNCIAYQLDEFKSQFISLCSNDVDDKNVFDEERFAQSEVQAWDRVNGSRFIESGLIETNFNLVDSLKTWIAADEAEENFEGIDSFENENIDDFDALTGKGGLFENILYDENTIIENSVPVSSLPSAGRNDPCPCGSGKKYKKCCLQ